MCILQFHFPRCFWNLSEFVKRLKHSTFLKSCSVSTHGKCWRSSTVWGLRTSPRQTHEPLRRHTAASTVQQYQYLLQFWWMLKTWSDQLTYTYICSKVRGWYYFWMFLKEAYSPHRGCNYLIKNKVKRFSDQETFLIIINIREQLCSLIG